MDTRTREKYQYWLTEHGYKELGQVSPLDHYWVHPINCELVHLLHSPSGWIWFFGQYPLEDVYAILNTCVHYELRGMPPEVSDKSLSHIARDRMLALFPTFSFFQNKE